jgi:predicted signal transduction protein with EAL and GGDEF domain
MSLAEAFGLDVIAEGVETAAAARELLALDCYRAQGFLLSRPLDSVAMESLLARRFVPMDFSDVGVSAPDDSSASNNHGTGKAPPEGLHPTLGSDPPR